MLSNSLKLQRVEGISSSLIRKTVLTYIFVFLLIGVTVFFILPRVESLNRIRSDIEKKELKRDDLRLSLSVLDDFSRRIGLSGEKIVFLTLPSEFNPSLALADLRALSSVAGVNISSYSFSGGEVDGKMVRNEKKKGKGDIDVSLKKVGFDLKVSGEPLALFDFIGSLEKNMPLLEMHDVQMSELSTAFLEKKNNLISMTLKLDYFYLPYEVNDQSNSLSELIDEKDMIIFDKLKNFRKPVYGVGVKSFNVNGGNKNLFGGE